MKLRNATTKYAAAALSAAAALLLLASARAACLAQSSGGARPQAANYGALTLNAGQTARLNVLNAVFVQPEDATHDGTDSDLPAVQRAPRTLTLAFDLYAAEPATDDGSSRAVTRYRFLRRVSKEVTLGPGEGASFEFTAAEGMRVNAVVIGPPDARGRGDGGVEDPNQRGGVADVSVLTTVEVREGGRTSFVHPGAARGMIVCGSRPSQR